MNVLGALIGLTMMWKAWNVIMVSKRKEIKAMKPEVLCPKWGHCKATKKCPLSKPEESELFTVYVYGKCANSNVKIKSIPKPFGSRGGEQR